MAILVTLEPISEGDIHWKLAPIKMKGYRLGHFGHFGAHFSRRHPLKIGANKKWRDIRYFIFRDKLRSRNCHRLLLWPKKQESDPKNAIIWLWTLSPERTVKKLRSQLIKEQKGISAVLRCSCQHDNKSTKILIWKHITSQVSNLIYTHFNVNNF